MPTRATPVGPTAALGEIAQQLLALRAEMRDRHVASSARFDAINPNHRPGAANLIDYLTLRRHDVRGLQDDLARAGLSSLGRADEHVLATIERVLETIRVLEGEPGGAFTEAAVAHGEGERELARNAAALLGNAPPGRSTRILVTMPTEAASRPVLVRELLERGMDCARINTAHDDPDTWVAIADNLRAASEHLGKPCRILVDLPGPKLRTGPIRPGERVVRLRPKRDLRGRVVAPAVAHLVTLDTAAVADPDALPLDAAWLASLGVGDEVRLRDTRDALRRWRVATTSPDEAWCEVGDTTYVAEGTRLEAPSGRSAIGALPPSERTLRLRAGDLVTITADEVVADPDGTLRPDGSRAFVLGCTLPEAITALEPGQRVYFDDGKIGGEVVSRHPRSADVSITLAGRQGSKLGADKGINVPDTVLDIRAVSDADEPILRFAVSHADGVELSFAQSVDDVLALEARLGALGGDHLGIVLKIETVRGFVLLPDLLLAVMRSERVGVMVARGDLAVECGYERLAEVQEEILGLCAAAHVPLIWATQVLDQMARTGRPSRAEVSDAVMAGRAECVMLNKGPYILDAVEGLDDILRRMSAHQRKKVALLRRLASWSTTPA